jgi:hypothetical protein
MKTKVIFRIYKDSEVIALFPEMSGTNNPSTCGSYMHVGQHGAASPELIQTTRPASRKEYAPLAAELRRIGYRLRIVRRFSRADYFARRAEILKTGSTD